MEYFILALIGKAGLTSLYAFQQRAGLQPGGIRSALERLEALQLITRAESSTRQRRDMSLTSEGTEVLNYSWKRCLDMQILAPMIGYRRRNTEAAQNTDTDGNTKKPPVLIGFRAVYVFDVAQTEGEDLPEFEHNISGEVGEHRDPGPP